MADLVEIKVVGLAQLQANLASFGSDKIMGRVVRAALQAGARRVRGPAAANARGLGLGFQGFKRDDKGRKSPRYGRIPRSIKVGKSYIPKGAPDLYRVNVVARGQRSAGIFKNKAPHAHFIEYGFTRYGRTFPARPFLGPALSAQASTVTEVIRDTMARRIDAIKMPQ